MRKSDGGLYRSYFEAKVGVNGFLDDYAVTISGYISLYEATFNEEWLNKANELSMYAVAHFSDENNRYFYYTSDENESLITRKQEMGDNVIASSNSMMAKNLFLLGQYFYQPELVDRSREMLKGVVPDLKLYGSYYYNWFSLLVMNRYPFYEVAIVGKNAKVLGEQLRSEYLPNVIYLGGEKEGSLELLSNKLVKGKTFIYVCRGKACKLPVEDPEKAIQQITY